MKLYRMLLLTCLTTAYVVSSSEPLLKAINAYDVKQLDIELQKYGPLKRSVRKELLRAVDTCINHAAVSNVWYKKYDAIAQLIISIPLLVIATYYLYHIPKVAEPSLIDNISSLFAAKVRVGIVPQGSSPVVPKGPSAPVGSVPHPKMSLPKPAVKQPASGPTTSAVVKGPLEVPAKPSETSEIPRRIINPPLNTILIAVSGLCAGAGIACLASSIVKFMQYNSRYVQALAMRTLIQASPDNKSEEYS
jgi:hypothetical protein